MPSGWRPPDPAGPITTDEAIRVIGRQVDTLTGMVGNVAAYMERHEHWHDQQRDAELAQAQARPRKQALLWAQLVASICTLVSVIVVLAHLSGR